MRSDTRSDRAQHSDVEDRREIARRLRASRERIEHEKREELVGKALFLDEAGAVLPAAHDFFLLLADLAGMGKAHFSTDPLELARRAGHRELALRIAQMGQIDGAAMEKMVGRYRDLKYQIDVMENDDE